MPSDSDVSTAAANPLAFRVGKAILEAAHDFELKLDQNVLRFKVTRVDLGHWPTRGLPHVSPDSEGPWPGPVELRCAWDGGSVRLRLELTYWRARTGRYAQLISLRGYLPDARRELLWSTLALELAKADQDERAVTASFAPFKRLAPGQPLATEVTSAVRAIVEEAKLPLSGLARIEVCRVQAAADRISPAPETAFERIASLCVLKLPFFDRDGSSFQGAPPFVVPRWTASKDVAPTSALSSRKAGIFPLPGGVRQYKRSLDSILEELQRRPRSSAEFYELLQARFGVSGKVSRDSYLSVPLGVRLCEYTHALLMLTEAGQQYLSRGASASELFELLHANYIGVLEVLVLAESFGRESVEETVAALKTLLAVDWESSNQISFRRNWLLSLGLTDRTASGDALTELGREILHKHAEEARSIRERLDELIDEVAESVTEDVGGESEENLATPGLDDVTPAASSKPAAWGGDRVDLTVQQLQEAAKTLAIDSRLLGRVCAALFAGKHLLLVGPPGTGKTELARAIATAATSEEYCAGAFLATASADWTTFDTIGGYALQRDGSLMFRSGALLRAAERWQWLIIDELNRADVDRAFGELMTVLSGQTSDTAYELSDGRQVRIGPDPTASHPIPNSFRVLATMNTWDKTSLFRLSYAVQRRFAIIHVGVPSDGTFEALLRRKATEEGVDRALDAAAASTLSGLFMSRGLGAVRAIGPAIALDVVRYVRSRITADATSSYDAIGEALDMFVLPQLEGLDEQAARRAHEVIDQALARRWSAEARDELLARYRELFPYLELS